MAGRKGLLGFLLCTVFMLSFAHIAFAGWYSSPYEDDSSYKQPSKKYRGYYNGLPFDDSEGDDEYSEQQPYYTQPQPYYKPLPLKKPKPVRKPTPQPPQIMSSPPPAQITQSRRPPVYKPPQETQPPVRQAPPQNSTPPVYKPPQGAPPSYTPLPSPSPPTTPSYFPSTSLQKQWLDPHNAARAEVGVPPLVWSDTLAQYAESWANQRKASGCGLQHSNGPYGENIFWGSGGGYGPAECVAAWVQEKQYYNYADNSCAPGQQCGHYTQIVWASSANLGCARVQCDSGQIFMTCNYDPPGNWIGSRPY